MSREDAFVELKGRLKNPNLIRHSLAVEAIMRALAGHFEEDVEKWGLTGLLHDIDLEKVEQDMSKHSLVGAQILEDIGMDSSIVYAVKAHNEYHGIERKRKMDKALFSADPVSRLIVASVGIHASEKLKDVNVEFILGRMNEEGFIKAAARDGIKACEEFGMPLEQFIEISLRAMKDISAELGL